MKRTILLAVLAALAGTAAAQSQGAYVGGNVGRAEQKITVAGFSEKDHDTGFKLYGGYNFNQYVGLEGGYADLRKLELAGGNDRLSVHPTAAYFAVTGTLPLDQQFSLFGKVGAAYNRVKSHESGIGYNDSYTDNRTDVYVSVGAAYAINQNFSAVVEYENFGKPAKGDIGNLKASMVSVGVRYKF